MNLETLFRPFAIKGMELPNRIVMAPMTRNMAPNGIAGPAQVEYYRKRAAGGVGLILTEGTVINRPASRNLPGIPFFHGEESLKGWADVAAAVHAENGHIAPQIWHTGSTEVKGWAPDAEVESPSGLLGPNHPRGRAMTDEDIADTISAFAEAALTARKLGFDAVELHGAHGYLIDQFFWEGTNLRTDSWSGPTIRERSRFALEIVKAVRAAIGTDAPLILRVSQWKQQDYKVRLANTPDELEAWLLPLVEAGVDILHCSQRRFWTPEFAEVDGENGLNLAGWAKKVTGAATISVGSVGLDSDFFGAVAKQESSQIAALDKLIERMERDEFDLIAVGRSLLADPLWAQKLKEGRMDELQGFDGQALLSLN